MAIVEGRNCMIEVEDVAEIATLATSAEAFFNQPGVKVVDPVQAQAERLQKVSGYRWGRWMSTSGITKLHLRDGAILGCGLAE